MNFISFYKKSNRFLVFYFCLLFFYLLIPFFLIKTKNFFYIIKNSFVQYEQMLAFQNTLKLANIELLFIFFTFISLILYFFVKIFCNVSRRRVNVDSSNFYLYIILIFCSLILFSEICFLTFKLFTKEISFSRDNIYINFLSNKPTTHIIVGSIIALYLFIEKKNKLSIVFSFLLIIFSFLTFSRFELMLLLISYFLFIKKKKIKYLLYIIIFVVLYRLIIYSFILKKSFLDIFLSILWEPCSLWINAITSFSNYLYFFENKNFLYQVFLDNFSIEALSNKRYEQIFFKKNFIFNTVSTARLGFFEFLGYPSTILGLAIFAFLQKKFISNFVNLENLYYILSVYLIFFSIRGSLLNGFLFINKFLLLIITLFFIKRYLEYLKKLTIKYL